MNTREILIAGRALIADPEHWTQGAIARNLENRSINSDRADACKFCSIGALNKCSTNKNSAPIIALMVTMEGNVSCFNDTHTHAEVLAAWDRAIANEVTA
jgi:hypothetical protein